MERKTQIPRIAGLWKTATLLGEYERLFRFQKDFCFLGTYLEFLSTMIFLTNET